MSDAILRSLQSQLSECLPVDKIQLQRRLQGVQRLPANKQAAVLTIIGQELEKARGRALLRQQNIPQLHYPDLPVTDKRHDIADAIRKHQVVIVAGETGSGKTTQLPKICIEAGRGLQGMIGHTQPRRLAARTVAARIAEELHCELGSHVGYKVRFHDQVNESSYIKLMTDGILLAEIQNDRMLTQYDTIIIDEAHERSLNIDFILGYLKQLLPKRPDLKLIITSATIDPQRFSRHFSNAPVIEVSGRTYPVEVRYRPWQEEEDSDPLQGLFNAVDELCVEGLGDILIFMNGEREIRDTADALRKRNLRDTEILPLYSRLSNAEQNRIFSPHAGRRIVLATNVAETSLTVPGIRYVIDPGTARISRYSYKTKVQRLPIEPVSQASANQRKGRCGRVAAGICIRLYSELDFLGRPEFTDPEILRTNLASVILQMLALGLGDMSRFPFVEAPDSRHIKDGLRLLEELGAISGSIEGKQSLRLTPLGRQLARVPLDPRLARMVLAAPQFGCLEEILIITSALSIQDPRERPMDKQQASDEKHRRFEDKDSDFQAFLNLWNYVQEQQDTLSQNQFRKQCQKEFLSYLRLREWQDIHYQVRQATRELSLTINQDAAPEQAIHSAILTGLLSHIGVKDGDKSEYIGARNARFMIFPGSGLFKKPPKWSMVAELTETSRLYGRTAARIQPEWIEPLAQHLIKKNYSDPRWSKKAGAVLASEKVTLYGITLVADREVQYGTIDPVVSRELFIRRALVEGDFETRHRFFAENRKLLAEVEALEAKSRRRDILVDDETLYLFYDAHIPADVVSARHFDSWWMVASKETPELLNFEREMLLQGDASHINEHDYPNQWTQGRLKFRLSYQFEPGEEADGVTVHIPLPLLNQVEPLGFDWLIPGMRHELLIALIKSLPKQWRKNFVPAPNYADALLASISPEQGPLLDAVERQLKRMSGLTVPRECWDWNAIPDHLKMTFRVIDDKRRKVAESKDLLLLKEQLREQVQQTLSQVADDDIEQEGLTLWSFGPLPQQYSQKRGGFEVKAYPALVDQKDSVAIQLFDSPAAQQSAMWAGQRRLVLLNVPSPIKYLQEKLPNKAKLGLYFTPFGKVADLIDDCIACGCDQLMQQHGGLSWDSDTFQQQKELIRGELNEAVVKIAAQVEQILTAAHGIRKQFKGKMTLELAFSHSDIQAQLERLIHKGFVTETGAARLPDLLRYMKGIERRMEKIPVDANRDRMYMLKVQHAEQAYQQLLGKLPKGQAIPEEVRNIRWMIEELRISYFAQVLGTPYAVSDKRVLQAIEAIKV
ncbi:ATP-dependent helicase HrpA [Tolumonas auensis DSM 9187]|uniref:RNA helicase n=1 Tax=Tolumonas auensis (strain DSM 9187 / NBRC 110442 / TA 4) TaxID=595494 RepID=C4LE72_TOLAT|nr:ATP-dependent RNA helicase HrpA [Tolumonas auensis]ACQ92893.1 ATP-dependent helicase HrpA [Tolumonas auensis DSM 9187]